MKQFNKFLKLTKAHEVEWDLKYNPFGEDFYVKIWIHSWHCQIEGTTDLNETSTEAIKEINARLEYNESQSKTSLFKEEE
jgi:hypothetical protein